MASTEDLFSAPNGAASGAAETSTGEGMPFASSEPPTVVADSSLEPTAAGEPMAAAGPAAAPLRQRRPRKKAAAPVLAAEPAVSPDHAAMEPHAADVPAAAEPQEAASASVAAESTAPAKTPRKRTSRKKAAVPPAEPAMVVEEIVPADDSAADGPTRADESAADLSNAVDAEATDLEVPDVSDEAVDATVESSGADTAYPPVVVPSFGLLFQAPTPPPAPARRASRRASSPVATVFEPPVIEPSDPRAADPEGVDDELTDELDPGHLPDPAAAEDGDEVGPAGRRRRRRGGKGRRPRTTDDAGEGSEDSTAMPDGDAVSSESEGDNESESDTDAGDGVDEATGAGATRRRTRRRRRTGTGTTTDADDAPGVVTRVRAPRPERDEVTGVRGSTRLEAKRQRRREGREAGRRRTIITEAEFLARRESVERVMVVRAIEGRTQIGVLEDNVLVEHYVSRETTTTMAGNIYLGRVQNVLPSMEAAFVDIGRGRNAVLYAGEVNWDAAGLESGNSKRIENALESGQSVLVQVTKDPIGHKGARLTSQISLPGRYLVYVPDSSMTGISRKLPDTERARLKRILRDVVPESAGVIVRTAAEGASEEELRADVERLTAIWERIKAKAEAATTGRRGKSSGNAPTLLHGEPDMTVRVIRDVFNEDFTQLVVSGDRAWSEVSDYVASVAPDLAPRLVKWTGETDIFTHYRIHEQIAKAMDRKVWLPSGGSLVIDRTEAMTVVDVNTGKFVGSGGNLEETVTRNNIEAAEEIVRQLRLRDIGGIIVIDFIDMVLESNRDLVVRRLLECLGRDRTKHQVAEVTSLGLVQMTRKRVGSGLIEVFSDSCDHCNGRGYVIHTEPIERPGGAPADPDTAPSSGAPIASGSGSAPQRSRTRRGRSGMPSDQLPAKLPVPPPGGPTPAQIAAAAHAAAVKSSEAQAPVEQAADLAEIDVPKADLVEVDVPQDESTEVALGIDVEVATAAVEAPTVETEAAAPDVTTAPMSGRARRRRGRVVAPAGPPRVGDGSPTSTSGE